MKKIKFRVYKHIIGEEVYNLKDDLFKNILRGTQWKTDDSALKKLFWVIWDEGWIWQVLKIMQIFEGSYMRNMLSYRDLGSGVRQT